MVMGSGSVGGLPTDVPACTTARTFEGELAAADLASHAAHQAARGTGAVLQGREAARAGGAAGKCVGLQRSTCESPGLSKQDSMAPQACLAAQTSYNVRFAKPIMTSVPSGKTSFWMQAPVCKMVALRPASFVSTTASGRSPWAAASEAASPQLATKARRRGRANMVLEGAVAIVV